MTIVLWIVAVFFGAILGILLSAMSIRCATSWLGLGKVTYATSIRTSVISNFTGLAINAAIGFEYGLMAASTARGKRTDFMELMTYQMTSPVQLVYLTALALTISACIYQMTIKPTNGLPTYGKDGDVAPVIRDLKFSEAFGLVAFSQGLTVFIIMLIYGLFILFLWAAVRVF